MVDNKTAHLGLPLPDLGNEQTEDVPRIGQALAMLDARAQSVDAALEVQSGEVQALKASDTAHDERLESLKQNLEQEAIARAAADREASGRLQTLSDTQTSLGLRVDSLDDTAAEQASRLEEVASTISSTSFVFIGHVFPLLATDSYVPEGCVPANGGEYTRAQFPSLYDTYLVGGKLLTCTYAEQTAQVALTGNCAKFALDKDAQKFKVPLLKDGDSITQASSAAEIGKSVKAGLPNIVGRPGLDGGSTTGTGPFSSKMGSGFRPYGQVEGSYDVTFDAKRVSPVYRNDVTTVLDEQVRLRHFVVVANAQNSSSVFDWSNYMAGLAGKLNTDFSNADFSKYSAVRQIVPYETGELIVVSTAMYIDDTKPQITEGTQVMAATITPKSATSKLRIDVIVHATPTGSADWLAALFLGANADAIAAMVGTNQTAWSSSLSFSHIMPSPGITPVTFSVRVGAWNAALNFNGKSGARLMGGAMASSIIITEYAA